MVESFVDFLACTISPEESAEDALSTNPHDFCGQPSFLGTFAFAETCVTTFLHSFAVESRARARVNLDGVLDDEAVLDEFAHALPRVSERNLLGFVGVHPHPALAALEYASSESLLQSHCDHFMAGI